VVDCFQPLDQITHLAPGKRASSGFTEMSATTKRTAFINLAATISPEEGTGSIRRNHDLFPPRRPPGLGRHEGLSLREKRRPTIQAKRTTSRDARAVPLRRPPGEIGINRLHGSGLVNGSRHAAVFPRSPLTVNPRQWKAENSVPEKPSMTEATENNQAASSLSHPSTPPTRRPSALWVSGPTQHALKALNTFSG
jgi:hypothetical protein